MLKSVCFVHNENSCTTYKQKKIVSKFYDINACIEGKEKQKN